MTKADFFSGLILSAFFLGTQSTANADPALAAPKVEAKAPSAAAVAAAVAGAAATPAATTPAVAVPTVPAQVPISPAAPAPVAVPSSLPMAPAGAVVPSTTTSLGGAAEVVGAESQSVDSLGHKFQGLAELLKMRDPFRPPIHAADLDADKSEIERTPVVQFTMVGVMAGPHHFRAILKSDLTGKVFLVSEGAKVGPHNGYIRKILEDRVIVNENTTDLLGEREIVTTEIKLVPVKSAKGTIADYNTTAVPGVSSTGQQSPTSPSGLDNNGQPLGQNGTSLPQGAAAAGAALSPTQELIQQAQALMNPNAVAGYNSAGVPTVTVPAPVSIPQVSVPGNAQVNTQVNPQSNNTNAPLVMPLPPDAVQNTAVPNSTVAPTGAGAVK